MKHVYRAIIFVLVFVGSVFAFSGRMKETQGAGTTKSIEQSSPTFPIMVVRTQGYDINVLHGYNSNLKASLNRESMTPIGIDKKFQLVISENETNIRKLKYELRKVNDNALMETNEISVLEETKEGKIATITLEGAIEQRQEYALKVTAISKEGKKIHYFTHLKYYGDDSFLEEKMNFVLDFHENTLKQSKMDQISTYLESSYLTPSSNDYAHVDITSSKEMVCWGNLNPEMVSDIVPTVKEFNIETAAICLEYYVKIHPKKDLEQLCKVKEFFRVRYSGGRMYLLKYNRDMESLFSIDQFDKKNNQIQLGIGEKGEDSVVYSEDSSRMAFVTGGELWSYSFPENTLYRIFSFRQDSQDYERAAYDQHNVKIIDLDEDGNMNFMVYGYMNTGDYEGCVGILWYKYYAGEQRIEEQVFIPMETTYQILKENLDSFTYVSDGDVFYFSVQNVIYYYDVVSKQVKVVAKNVAEGDYCYVEEDRAGLLAWQGDSNDAASRKIVLMDLDTKKQQNIETDETERVLLIGSIDTNIVYGLVKTSDMQEQADGSTFAPMYKVCISDKSGNVLKEYKEKNIYISKAYVEGNVVKLQRVKKTSGKYKEMKDDSIQNQNQKQDPVMGIASHITDYDSKEYYIYIKSNYSISVKPELMDAKTTMITESSIVRLDGNETDISRYYVYAEGVILDAYASPSKAINAAEEAMGVVVNENNQLVYERAGKLNGNSVGSISHIRTGNGVNAKGACIAMVLKFQHLSANAKALSSSSKSAYSLLKEKMGEEIKVLNLKGCTLDEVLYFVSNERPVLALIGGENMVVITEYSMIENTVKYYNPSTGRTETKGMAAAAQMFEAAGNAFVSYLK